MSIRNNLNEAEVLFRQKNYKESSVICSKLLNKKSNLFGALQLEGLNQQGLGEYQLALGLFTKAIKAKPLNASTYNNIGNVYLTLADYKNAAKSYYKALELEPLMAAAINNLANCQIKLGDVESAIVGYKKAILHEPKNAEFHLNYGVLLTDIGDFTPAQELLSKALALDSSITSIYWHIFKIQLHLHRYQDALEIVELGIASQSLSEPELCELLIGRAMVLWLFCEFEAANDAIRLSEKIVDYKGISKNMANMGVFHHYIKRLLVARKQNEPLYLQSGNDVELENIFFISESHGFAPNNVVVNYQSKEYQIRSLFILGAKIFHMVAEKDNQYQVSLSRVLESLPSKSKVVLAFGEIDCRKDEGIFAHCLRTGDNYKNVINSMLENYVETLHKIAEGYQLEIILYGVPAPHSFHVNALPKEQRNSFQRTIEYFNKKLQLCCKQYNIVLLDVYTLTNESGSSNELHHIDPIHMQPNVIAKLFESLR